MLQTTAITISAKVAYLGWKGESNPRQLFHRQLCYHYTTNTIEILLPILRLLTYLQDTISTILHLAVPRGFEPLLTAWQAAVITRLYYGTKIICFANALFATLNGIGGHTTVYIRSYSGLTFPPWLTLAKQMTFFITPTILKYIRMWLSFWTFIQLLTASSADKTISTLHINWF